MNMQMPIAISTAPHIVIIPPKRRAGSAWRARPAVLLAVLLIAALAVRAFDIGHASLWLDEANSWYVAHLSWPAMFANLRASPLGPLYFVGLKLWMSLAGQSEAALRWPSLIAGVLLIPAVYAIGVRTVGETPARIAAVLTTISPLHLYFSQEARMYMPLALGGALCALAYTHWRDAVLDARNPGAPLAAFAACGIALLATNVVVLPLIVALEVDAVLVLVTGPTPYDRRRALRGWLVANIIIAIGAAAVYTTMHADAAASSQAWRAPLGIADALRALVQYPLHAMNGLYFYPDELGRAIADARLAHDTPTIIRLLRLAVAGPLVVLAIVIALARAGAIGRGRARVVLLACAIPLAAMTVISLQRQVELERYALYASPFLFLAIGLGVSRLPRMGRALALSVFGTAAVLGTMRTMRVASHDSDYRPVASHLIVHAADAARVIVQPDQVRQPLLYYVQGHLHLPVVAVRDDAAARRALAASGAPAWVVLDYRSPLYDASPDSLRAALDACIAADSYEAGAEAGVRLVLARPSDACAPTVTGR